MSARSPVMPAYQPALRGGVHTIYWVGILMAQHFSQSKKYRDLEIFEITRLTEEEAWQKFVMMRWGSLATMPCPICGAIDTHYPRRARKQWRCKHCDAVFSVTTDTPFKNRRLSFGKLLILIYWFVVEPKGAAANKLLAPFGITLRTAYINFGKIREAIFQTMDLTPLTGNVQIDGAHCCGKPRRPRKRNKMTSGIANNILRNRKASIVPPTRGMSIEPWNKEKLENRRIVLVLRELFPEKGKGARRTIAVVVKAENRKNVIPIIQKYVSKGAMIETDDGHAYSTLSAWYDHQSVNHSKEYCRDDGVNNNQAESYIGRLRRSEYGTYHGLRPQYLAFYAAEMAWREDVRVLSLKTKFENLFKRIFQSDISRAWRGYNQGHRLGFEYLG